MDAVDETIVPKILAPIKAYTGAVRVVDAGADELYCGVRTPGLEDFELYRGSSTEIPTYDEFHKVTEYAHSHGVKVFVTINQPFIIDSMEKTMVKHIRKCVEGGADSLIIGDLGVLPETFQVKGFPLLQKLRPSPVDDNEPQLKHDLFSMRASWQGI